MAYSPRRVVPAPLLTVALHATVAICLAVQLLTLFVPALRAMLGLVPSDLRGLLFAIVAVLLSWTAAEMYVRLPARRRFKTVWDLLNLRFIRRAFIAIAGFTVLLIGLALIVLPGPATLVIPLGLVILATEFVWARTILRKSRRLLSPGPKRL